MAENTIEIIFRIISAVILLTISYFLKFVDFEWDKERVLPILIIIIQYILIHHSIRHISKCFFNWKHYGKLKKVVDFPDMFFPLVIKPYMKMFMGLTVFLGVLLLGILWIYRYVPEYIGYNLSYETKLYLYITTIVIIIRSFGNGLIKNLVKLYFKSENRKEHVEFTLHLVNEARIRYLIYLLFFLAMLIFSFLGLENIDVFTHKKIGIAVISSFGTFIAFDRLFNSWSLIKFSPKKHWRLLVKVYQKDSKYENQSNYLINTDKDLKEE